MRVAAAYDSLLKEQREQRVAVMNLEATVAEERRLAARAGANHSADIHARLDEFTNQLQEEKELDALEFEEALGALQRRLWAVSLGVSRVRELARATYSIYYTAAATIQGVWLAYVGRRRAGPSASFIGATGGAKRCKRRVYLTRLDSAAFAVQQVWRGYVQRRIFRFYVRAISNCGDKSGSQLLKAIDYGESCMLMGMSDLHVRFRLSSLGPNAFPPVVVFKVSSHVRVTDIGLFAPKDYVRTERDGAAKRRKLGRIHNKPNKGTATTRCDTRDDWYVRDDRNPWRPVDAAAISKMMPSLTATLAKGALLSAEQKAMLVSQHINPQTAKEKLLRSVGRAGKTPVSVTASVSYGATGNQRRKQEGWSVEATRRRWLAELYASEKVFQQRQHLQAAAKGSPMGEEPFPSPDPPVAPLLTFHEHRAEATALFRNVPPEDVEVELARLREWSEGLDYQVYLTQWRALGLAL